MKIDELTITQTNAPSLDALLHHPARSAHRGAIIVAHGMLSFKESPKHRAICEVAAEHGVTAMRFDFRGRGSSAGDPELLTVTNEMADLRTVNHWLTSRGYGPIGWIGSSLGGTVALLEAANQSPDALVTMSSPAHLPASPRSAWHQQLPVEGDRVEVVPGVFISTRFFSDALTHDPVKAASAIKCPWLIAHGARDELIPEHDPREMARIAPRAELRIHPFADHRFSTQDQHDWLIHLVTSWILPRLAATAACRARSGSQPPR